MEKLVENAVIALYDYSYVIGTLVCVVLLIVLNRLHKACQNLESQRILSLKKGYDIAPNLYLSIIIPAYNEQDRIVKTLKSLKEYISNSFLKKADLSFEVIVVDDGSKDSMNEVVTSFSNSESFPIKIVNLEKNSGKGEAVRQGIFKSNGFICLFMDADGATDMKCIEKLHNKLIAHLNVERLINESNTKNGIPSFYTTTKVQEISVLVLGSRAHIQKSAVASRSFYRNTLMYGFQWCVYFVTRSNIKDTQCGFKMFTRKAATKLFITMRIRRFCFDVELVYLAQKCKMMIEEVPVRWTEVNGSKVKWFHIFTMAWELAMIRYGYSMFGNWKIQ